MLACLYRNKHDNQTLSAKYILTQNASGSGKIPDCQSLAHAIAAH
ncbi:hypothetical protein [Laspinema olomoucense]|nr:hypothetical protein [Laspinema sp. D3c]